MDWISVVRQKIFQKRKQAILTQQLACALHSKKTSPSVPGLCGLFCVEFTCSLCVRVNFLRVLGLYASSQNMHNRLILMLDSFDRESSSNLESPGTGLQLPSASDRFPQRHWTMDQMQSMNFLMRTTKYTLTFAESYKNKNTRGHSWQKSVMAVLGLWWGTQFILVQLSQTFWSRVSSEALYDQSRSPLLQRTSKHCQWIQHTSNKISIFSQNQN